MVAYDQVSQQQEEQENAENLVLGIQEDNIKSFVIETVAKTPDGETAHRLLFTRPNEAETPTQWQVKIDDQEPIQASDGAIAFLTNLVATGQSDGQLMGTEKQLTEYGLDKPRAQLTITLKTGDKRELKLGLAGFNDQFIYAQVEPNTKPESENSDISTENETSEAASKTDTGAQPQGKVIYTIPKDFEYALIRELDEWKYVPSPNPSESPNPEASPSP